MQDAPLHRLEAVVCIRERPGNDDAHRVIQVRPAHFLVDIDLLNCPYLHLFSTPVKQKEVSGLARDFPFIA
jgi:hypothetical protein